MRKFFGIIVLCFFSVVSVNTNADIPNIKVEALECVAGSIKERAENQFIFFSQDKKKATIKMKDNELKNKLIVAIANQMKKSYVNWNLDTVDDEIIFNQLAKLSNKKLHIPEGTELFKFMPNPKQQYARKKKKNNRNHRNHKN